MPRMTLTKPRATFEETLEFCNRVRQAGGGNPLDALMPAVPVDSSQCLIARNLNFNCRVEGLDHLDEDSPVVRDALAHAYFKYGEDNPLWVMSVDDNEPLAAAIGQALELPWLWDGDVEDGVPYGQWVVILPPEIGMVAHDFDHYSEPIRYMGARANRHYEINPAASSEELQQLKDFWPYIEASVKEAYENAPFCNANGELIL